MAQESGRNENSEVRFNPWNENFRRNPYPFYRPLLSGPMVVRFLVPTALVARYADVTMVLRDHQRFSSKPLSNLIADTRREVFGNEFAVLSSDPPVHTRLRRLISRDFTPRRIGELEPRIREITNRLLDEIARKPRFDLMRDLAIPLPVTVIAEVLGIASEKYETFKRWSDRIIESTALMPGAPLPQHIRDDLAEMRAYFGEEIERRRRHPGRDLMSALVAAHDGGESLSAGELMQFLVLLLLAGNETTTNLIGNGTLALMRHPEQMAMLRANPALLPGAIEEMLRYDGPVHAIFRTTPADAEIGGVFVEKGSAILVLLAAANRDPAQFPDPDSFDIRREPNEHVAFGDGIHYCIGAPLARLEAAIAFGSMLRRFPRLSLTAPEDEPSYKGSLFVRGLAALPMSVE